MAAGVVHSLGTTPFEDVRGFLGVDGGGRVRRDFLQAMLQYVPCWYMRPLKRVAESSEWAFN